jgi:drug/metabolite transporter (DMT)-like permease
MIDSDLVLGVGAAVAATGCFETSYVLQAREARQTSPELALRPSLLTALLRRPLWAGAIALGIAGWGLQILALGLAPLTVVQPVLSLGLVLLMYLSVRLLGESVGRREILSAVAIVGGVIALTLSAPDRASSVSHTAGLVIALLALGATALAPYAVRAARIVAPALLLAASAGAADATAGVVAKLVSDDLSRGRVLAAVLWAALAGGTVLLGLLSETTALQRMPVTRVGPVVLVLQVVIPVALAPLVFGESWSDTALGGGVIVAALVVVAVGTAGLAGSEMVEDLRGPETLQDQRSG